MTKQEKPVTATPKLRTVKRQDGWWITGTDEPFGPYETKGEADSDRHGLNVFYELDAEERAAEGRDAA